MSHDSRAQSVFVIEPSRGRVSLGLRELWEHRELVGYLAWRDIKVRYKQTALGAGWAVLQPTLTMVLFSIFFGRLAHVPSDGVPYPLFAFAALVPWTLFSNGLAHAGNSLVENAGMLKKVYFPRLALPIASVATALVDFCVALGALLGFMAVGGRWPRAEIVWLPAFVLLALVTVLAAGLWLSAINIRYRDVRYTIPFLLQVWLFATPIAYPSSLLSEPWRTIYGLNPMVGVVEGFRWALLGTPAPGPVAAVSAGVALAALVAGAFYFSRTERTFADVG